MMINNTLDQETIKETNRKKILNLLYRKKELTRQDIAREIGISIPTIANNINELIREGIVEEAGVADSTGGRKPVIVRFIPDSRYSLGVDFSVDSVRIILTNLYSEIKEDVVFSTDESMDFGEIMSHIRSVVEDIITKRQIPRSRILGIGFSLPGTVNEEKMLLETAPNLGYRNIDFTEYAAAFDFPIYIENEANAAAYAELSLGIAKQMRNLVYVSITKGIGAGIVLSGQLYKGKDKRAGEFGHMTVIVGGKQCNCGKKGCWEMYASGRALIGAYRQRAKKDINNLGQFFSLLEQNDEEAMEVWNSYLDYLAVGIQNIILVLNPHYIVVGGEIGQFGERLVEPLRDRVFEGISFYGKDDIKILASLLGEDSSIMGAALMPLKKLFFE